MNMEKSSSQYAIGLSPEKQKLLQKRLRGEITGGSFQQAGSRPRPVSVPLSFAQERLWFLDQIGGGRSPEFNLHVPLRVKGNLHKGALVRGINTIIERHETLRTHFEIVDGEPIQIVDSELKIDVPLVDLREPFMLKFVESVRNPSTYRRGH
jgi:hypothetical protein